MEAGATTFINFNHKNIYIMTIKNKKIKNYKSLNKTGNQIILLNGKSVKNIQDYKIQSNDTIYAVNTKSVIEEELLKPQGRTVDVWSLLNIVDFKNMYHEVYDFLNRKEDNRLLLWSSAMIENYYLVEAKPLPNPHKIIFLDHLIEYIYNFNNGGINALATLISLLTINKQPNIIVFGCDGLDSEDCKDVYYSQEKLGSKKLKRNKIYQDMIEFDQYIDPLIESLGGIENPILNVNKDSHYKSLHIVKEVKAGTSTSNNKFILNTPGFSGADIFQLIMNKESLENIAYLKRKAKTNLFKKLFKRFRNHLIP